VQSSVAALSAASARPAPPLMLFAPDGTGHCVAVCLDREGRLRAGQCFAHSLTWMWQPTEGIGVPTKADAVYLMFRSRLWQHEYGPTITQRIPIAWTPSTLGGRRP
jgi:hypothetical protein